MKTLRIFLLILIIIGIVLLLTEKLWVPKLVDKIIAREFPQQVTTPNIIPISIITQKINEENFSGTVADVFGTSPIAIQMREYIDKTVSGFRTQANTDVPSIRGQFGADNPTANYEIDITSKYIKSAETESIVTEVYTFTGGAHGSSLYKVMTANILSGEIIPLAKIIRQEKQNDFVTLVKKNLNDWRPEGTDAPVVFADSVEALKFDSFSNYSLDDKNLIIYFDQYAIGPGSLGTTPFPIPLTTIKDFLVSN